MGRASPDVILVVGTTKVASWNTVSRGRDFSDIIQVELNSSSTYCSPPWANNPLYWERSMIAKDTTDNHSGERESNEPQDRRRGQTGNPGRRLTGSQDQCRYRCRNDRGRAARTRRSGILDGAKWLASGAGIAPREFHHRSSCIVIACTYWPPNERIVFINFSGRVFVDILCKSYTEAPSPLLRSRGACFRQLAGGGLGQAAIWA